ncbi:hypothetical protein MJO29_000913 [Puccinia striiformis f. sp. tritici]|nr:hypothetical protein MJO29_000913 [Puccinia striiformis f. sp. tritici]
MRFTRAVVWSMLGLLSDTVLTMHVVASTPEEALASDAISASDGVTHWRPHDAYMPDERWHAEDCVTPKVLWGVSDQPRTRATRSQLGGAGLLAVFQLPARGPSATRDGLL